MYPPHNPQEYKSECTIRYPCRSKDDTYYTHERQNPVRCLNGLFASLMVVRVPSSSDREHAQALRRSLRSLTHVRMQPLDVNHAHRCWLHRQHLFVEKTHIYIYIYQIYLSFHVALLQLFRQHLYVLLFETKCWGTKDSKESSLFPCCCCCCLVAGGAAW